jgi:protein-S-isoprenylcysteine O-methyltransferase Ste14
MTRVFGMAFALVAYVIFFATFLYLVAFVGDFPLVPFTVDHGGTIVAPALAAAVNVSLIALFGVQHSGMARRAFKRWWLGIVPAPIERAIYVLASSLVLILMYTQWKPIPAILWSLSGTAAVAMWVLFALGWATVLLSTFLINHFELFGLQQAWLDLRGRKAADPEFRTPFLYRLVRHPLYLGFVLSFWAAPVMSVGRLVFAAGMTTFILVAIGFEEKDLIALFGKRYEEYRRKVGMLVPGLGRA